MKHETHCKRKGNIDIPAYGERNLARNLEENDKKIVVEPCRVGEREQSFEKVGLNNSNLIFFKNLIHKFRLIKNQFQLIKTDRGSLKFFKTISKQFRLIEK